MTSRSRARSPRLEGHSRSRRSSRLAHALALLAGLVALSPSGEARAQREGSAQVAQALFDQGVALMEAEDFAAACEKFIASQKLDPAGGTLLNIGLCREAQGKTASAWIAFREALSFAKRDERPRRAELAEEHIRKLEPRLVRVRVHVASAVMAANGTVRLDEVPLSSAAWSTPIPIDPGAHRLVVTFGTAREWTRDFEANAPGSVLDVEVPAEAVGAEVDVRRAAVDTKRSTGFWLLISGAGALAVTGAVTGLYALDDARYTDRVCVPARDYCRAGDAADVASRARVLAWTSTAAFALAGVAGAVAFFLPLDRAARVGVRVRGHGAGATVGLEFGGF